MMKFLKKLKSHHIIIYIVIGVIGLLFTILSLTKSLSLSTEFLLEKILISVILAVSLGLVVGFLGELSLGHAGFMCIGAYIGGKVAALLEPSMGNTLGVLLIAILTGGLSAALFGFLIGLPALRLKGDYLAIVTLAFGEIVKTIFKNTSAESFGGATGLETPRFDRNYLFIIGFVLVLIMIFVIQNLIRSKHGRAITAIRDSEIAAKATGINVTNYKLLVFALSAFFAGVAGVLYSYSNYRVQCDKFDYNYSIEILVMVVLGGMGNITGSTIAATLITFLQFLQVKLASILTGNLAVLQNMIYALILILIIIYNNAPALKGFREKYNVKVLMNRIFKPKKDPNAYKDDENKWDRVPTKIDMNEILSNDLKFEESTLDPDKGDAKHE